ncbi:hypothetical protein BOTBODRAFT_34951 [Botryobasidium botryosum FD-172 SS1]|uniref:Uncharacterized protein n=1 Tax=Botryobasidium botryosum (strain FD-172 SS1) TaxID=930990 RepID=A0A067MJ37_BOTB1|nr:hypothetical protein BOTBODRAFT_34951 [Botryobasidium botryosum FD-172 SS1]
MCLLFAIGMMMLVWMWPKVNACFFVSIAVLPSPGKIHVNVCTGGVLREGHIDTAAPAKVLYAQILAWKSLWLEISSSCKAGLGACRARSIYLYISLPSTGYPLDELLHLSVRANSEPHAHLQSRGPRKSWIERA